MRRFVVPPWRLGVSVVLILAGCLFLSALGWLFLLSLEEWFVPPAAGQDVDVTIDGQPLEAARVRIEITTREDAPGAPSPTGRGPKILWSPQWQARWEGEGTGGEAWYAWLEFAVANPTSAYFDKELFPTLLYQITGETRHARQAWSALDARIQRGLPSQDIIRANWLKWLVCYEWLYPALAEAEREALAAFFDRCAEAVAATPLADSDRLVTAWFGLRIWAALSGNQEPATSNQQLDRLVEYAKLSAGGDWVEGTYYNAGTTTTLLLGLAACRDLSIEVPAELAALPAQLALAERHRWDNTLSHRLTWGAIQPANYPRTGINRGDLVMDLWAAAGLHDMIGRAQAKAADESGRYWARPHAVFFLHADPDSSFANDKGQMTNDPPRHLVCPGQQLLYARSSWSDPDATCIMFRCGRHNGFAHHPTFDGGHFELLRKGEWVLSRPRAYSDSGNVDGLGANNSLLLGNQPLNFRRREMLGAGETSGCYWLVQEHGGPWQHGNNRTAEYVHSARRWLVWVPGADVDVLLVRDVIDISQPADQRGDRKAYNIGQAAERHAAYIESQSTDQKIPLVQWILHAPVEPEVRGQRSEVSWATPGGQHVRVTTLEQPTLLHVRLVDESLPGLYGRGVDARELGWQIRLSPAQVLDEELGRPIELLHAITISDAGAEPPAVSIEGAAVRVAGRLVRFTDGGIAVSDL